MEAPAKPARAMTKSMSTSVLGMKSLKKKKLPDNFADQVLDLELECEKSWVAVEHVNRLVELYSDAVEYYESIKDKKYVIFKNKIQQLFTRPQVMDALSRGSTGGNPGINEEEEKALEDRRARQRELEMNLYLLQKTASDKDAKSILSNHEKAWQDKEAMIKADLKGQEMALKARIEARKKRILDAQQAAKNPQDLNSGPGLLPMNEINGGKGYEGNLKQVELKSPASPDNPAKREEKFKKLLDVEELEMERDKKLKEIEKKYDPQISNLESKLEISGNNIIVTKLIAKLRSERENALKKVNDEYNEKTKQLNPLP